MKNLQTLLSLMPRGLHFNAFDEDNHSSAKSFKTIGDLKKEGHEFHPPRRIPCYQWLEEYGNSVNFGKSKKSCRNYILSIEDRKDKKELLNSCIGEKSTTYTYRYKNTRLGKFFAFAAGWLSVNAAKWWSNFGKIAEEKEKYEKPAPPSPNNNSGVNGGQNLFAQGKAKKKSLEEKNVKKKPLLEDTFNCIQDLWFSF